MLSARNLIEFLDKVGGIFKTGLRRKRGDRYTYEMICMMLTHIEEKRPNPYKWDYIKIYKKIVEKVKLYMTENYEWKKELDKLEKKIKIEINKRTNDTGDLDLSMSHSGITSSSLTVQIIG